MHTCNSRRSPMSTLEVEPELSPLRCPRGVRVAPCIACVRRPDRAAVLPDVPLAHRRPSSAVPDVLARGALHPAAAVRCAGHPAPLRHRRAHGERRGAGASPSYDRARAVAHFTGSMRTLVHQFKYADRHDGRTLFGRWLAEAARDLRARARPHRAGAAEPAADCCCATSIRPPCWPARCRARSAWPWTRCCSGARAGPGARSA